MLFLLYFLVSKRWIKIAQFTRVINFHFLERWGCRLGVTSAVRYASQTAHDIPSRHSVGENTRNCFHSPRTLFRSLTLLLLKWSWLNMPHTVIRIHIYSQDKSRWVEFRKYVDQRNVFNKKKSDKCYHGFQTLRLFRIIYKYL